MFFIQFYSLQSFVLVLSEEVFKRKGHVKESQLKERLSRMNPVWEANNSFGMCQGPLPVFPPCCDMAKGHLPGILMSWSSNLPVIRLSLANLFTLLHNLQ